MVVINSVVPLTPVFALKVATAPKNAPLPPTLNDVGDRVAFEVRLPICNVPAVFSETLAPTVIADDVIVTLLVDVLTDNAVVLTVAFVAAVLVVNNGDTVVVVLATKFVLNDNCVVLAVKTPATIPTGVMFATAVLFDI